MRILKPRTGKLAAVGVAATISILAAAAATGGSAAAKPLVGVGDNGPAMFLDPNYRALGTKISRKIIPYDFHHSPAEIQSLDLWVSRALALGVEPLISLQHSNINRKKLPSVSEFRKSVKFLRNRYPAVTTISPWNEANHISQPTFRNPRRAAEYFNATRALCKGCKIVAADLLDQTNMIPWLKVFKRHAKRPRIWGLHSYADANKNRSWGRSATNLLLKNVRGEVWLTEVGGLVAFKFNFPYNEQRAAKAVQKTLEIADRSRRIKRVYLYCWFGAVQPPSVPPYVWDSGLVSASSVPRPGYFVLRDWLKNN